MCAICGIINFDGSPVDAARGKEHYADTKRRALNS